MINSDTIGHHDTEADFSDINFDSSPLKSSSAEMIVSTVTLDAAGHHFMATTTKSINQLIQNSQSLMVQNQETNLLESENQLVTVTRGEAGQIHGLSSEGSHVQSFIQQGGQNTEEAQEHLMSLKREEIQEGIF